jgi:membrane protein implicated in regulation of membrane protease activity
MMPYIWLGVLVLAVILEAFTFALVSVWFVPGALVSMILAFIPGVPLWVQIVVFLTLTLVLMIFLKPIADKILIGKRVATNADAVIGEMAVVTEPINNIEAKGQVKVKGQIWSARASDQNTTYEIGEILNVIAIEGVKLICKK